ncbi:MAG: DUF2318 domain-containing protein [Clostridia bacterium]|nr:DUF2318 domain-containing protein [Clostridia bacterium]
MKKSNLILIILTIVLVCAAAAIIILNQLPESAPANEGGAQAIAEGEALVINKADIGSDVRFYPIDVDGTAMEVLAVKASDGTIRTAFNTCQSCFNSGAGYYVQEGRDLVCQNCGFHFTPEQVEIQSGGCNPWPIFPANKTETESDIQISYDFLKQSASIFANWK